MPFNLNAKLSKCKFLFDPFSGGMTPKSALILWPVVVVGAPILVADSRVTPAPPSHAPVYSSRSLQVQPSISSDC
jgi:hypothetical protein